MLVVNLFAGPGAGKSTTAAAAFAQLKCAGINAELVTEYAKDLVWSESGRTLACQPRVFAEQAWRIDRLRGKVDVVITDSPLLLSLVYGWDMPACWRDYVRWEVAKDNTLNFFLTRAKPYVAVGRLQTELDAKLLDTDILAELATERVPYRAIPGNQSAATIVFSAVMSELEDH
jgi:hypothetical protein